MTRGLVEFGPIRELIPEWAALVVALLTQLGDVWFLSLLVAGFYLYRTNDREEGAVLVGLLLAGFGVLLALKYAFALPRPDRTLVRLEALPAGVRPLYEATGTADGYGFPSGHAFMTTIIYVALARRLSVGTARQRLLGATAVVVTVCLSRVALGVHYLVDVVAGAAGGLLFLLVAEQLIERDATDRGTAAFALAVVAGAGAVLAASPDPDAVLLLGASLGGFGGWQVVRIFDRRSDPGGAPRSRIDRPPAIRIGLAIGAFALLAIALGYFGLIAPPAAGTLGQLGPVSSPAAAGALGFILAAVVAIPVLRAPRTDRAGRV